MTDNLREVLTRIAERAGPVSVDPLLWSKARHARRRRQRITAGAAVLVAVAAVGGTVLATGAIEESLPPAQRPADQEQRLDPIDIRGITGDGGLRLEKDLEIGRASVAIMNDTGAFVVTASDGVYHRIRLPGFDAPRYVQTAAASGIDSPEMLSLSPDGTHLAYAWHDPYVVAPDGRAEAGEGWIPSGARVLDLTTGKVTTFPPAGTSELDYLMTQLGRLTWNFRWSPDSRFVVFDQAVTSTMGWPSGEAWSGLLLDTASSVTPLYQEGPDANPRPIDDKRSGPEASAAAAVDNAGRVAWVGTPVEAGRLSSSGPRLMTWTGDHTSLQQLPDDVVWDAGRFSADGEALLIEPAGLDDEVLAVVPGRPAENRRLLLDGDLPNDQVKLDLQGWVADDQVLAVMHQATGSDTWKPDADLAVLTLDLDAGTADLTLVGHVDAADSGNVFSLATDLLAIDTSTNADDLEADQPFAATGSTASRRLPRGHRPRPAWNDAQVERPLTLAVAVLAAVLESGE